MIQSNEFFFIWEQPRISCSSFPMFGNQSNKPPSSFSKANPWIQNNKLNHPNRGCRSIQTYIGLINQAISLIKNALRSEITCNLTMLTIWRGSRGRKTTNSSTRFMNSGRKKDRATSITRCFTAS